MIEVKHEPRSAVKIIVEASWEDRTGTSRSIQARMENKSDGGACIRVPIPIPVGAKVRIQSSRHNFSGITRYCVSEGAEYLMGIQRDRTKRLLPRVPALNNNKNTVLKAVNKSDPPVSTNNLQASQELHEIKGRGTNTLQPQDLSGRRTTKHQTTLPDERQAGKKGTHMRHKWLDSTLWNKKQDDAGGSGSVAGAVTSSQTEPLPLEDIYGAAGIVNPRKGYGINKVVEMLHSAHIRALSKEMQRAAVLMALDAAGITVDEVLIDGRARQTALDSYEAKQTKQVEAEWARKAEEHDQIQKERERVNEQYAERLSRHQNAVAREKARFRSWQAEKQQASHDMSEAAELCLKIPVAEPTSPRPSKAGLAAAAGNMA